MPPLSRNAGDEESSTGAGATTSTINWPTGTATGDIAFWALGGSVASPGTPTTPAGWTLWETFFQTTTSPQACLVVWYRVVDGSESASYSRTGLTSGRWASLIDVWRGVDTTTPKDVANVTATNNSATPNHSAITPVTAGAVVLGWEDNTTPSGNTTMTYTSSNLSDVHFISSTAGAATNALLGSGWVAWGGSGSVTPVLTPGGGTPPRGVALSSALRPAVVDGVIQPIRFVGQTVSRSLVF